MKYQEILDSISALPSGSIVTDDSRFDQKFLAGTLKSYRGAYVRDYYITKSRLLNNKWYQKYYPIYNADDQDDPCCVKFKCPDVVTLDENSDGFRYVGTLNGTAYVRIANEGLFSTFKKHRYTNPLKIKEFSYIYDESSRMLRIYGIPNNQLRNLMVDAIFNDPTDILIATFNRIYDEYPIPDDAIPTIEQMIYLGQTRISSVTAPIPAGFPSAQPKQGRQKSPTV